MRLRVLHDGLGRISGPERRDARQPARWAALFALGALLGLAAAPASALPLVGDQTTIYVTADLGGLGISLVPGGGTSTDALGNLVLPITGGDVSIPLLEGTVEHQGSTLGLERGDTRIALENLVIDLTNSVVTGFLGLVVGGELQFGGEVALFDARSCLVSTGSDPCLDRDGSLLLNGFGLDLTETLTMFLNDAFDGDFARGDPLGVAFLDLRFETVPEPALGGLLLLAGVAALAQRQRRRAL